MVVQGHWSRTLAGRGDRFQGTGRGLVTRKISRDGHCRQRIEVGESRPVAALCFCLVAASGMRRHPIVGRLPARLSRRQGVCPELLRAPRPLMGRIRKRSAIKKLGGQVRSPGQWWQTTDGVRPRPHSHRRASAAGLGDQKHNHQTAPSARAAATRTREGRRHVGP